MTVLEFESWVTEHYDELVTVARQQCKHAQRDDMASDLLHSIVEGLLSDDRDAKGNMVRSSAEKVASLHAERLIRWFNRALSHDAMDAAKARENAAKARSEFEQLATALGADAFTDARAVTEARHSFNQKTRLIQSKNRAGLKSKKNKNRQDRTTIANPLEHIEWIGSVPGNVRWRFQTLRDDRLFIKRAIASQAESIWAAVKRQTHGLERGNSYTEFGLEASK